MIDLRTKGERLQWVREQLGLSRQEAKDRLGTTTSTLASYEAAEKGASNSRNFSYEKAEQFARKLGAPTAAHWIYTGKGAPPKLHEGGVPAEETELMTPVVGFFGVPTGEGALYGFDSEKLYRPCFAGHKTVAIELKGRSLAEGMYACFDHKEEPLNRTHTGMCVLGMGAQRILLRRIVFDDRGNQAIVPWGEEQSFDKRKVRWASRVIAIVPR